VEIVRNTQIEVKNLFEVRKKKEVQRERIQETRKKIVLQKEKAARVKRKIGKKIKNEIFVDEKKYIFLKNAGRSKIK